jgi:hypothetical protein
MGAEKAGKLASHRGVKLNARLADAAACEWEPARFDVVVAIFIQFAGPKLRDAIFAGIRRTLVPGRLAPVARVQARAQAAAASVLIVPMCTRMCSTGHDKALRANDVFDRVELSPAWWS